MCTYRVLNDPVSTVHGGRLFAPTILHVHVHMHADDSTNVVAALAATASVATAALYVLNYNKSKDQDALTTYSFPIARYHEQR
jgi:hypothetical protein